MNRQGRLWTKGEIQKLRFLVETRPKLSYEEIAKELGTNRTKWGVGIKIRKLGYSRRRVWKPEEIERLRELLRQFRLDWKGIARKTGRSEASIKRIIHVEGIRERPIPRKQKRWTTKEVARMVEMRRKGMTWQEIADELKRTVVSCQRKYAKLDIENWSKEVRR